MAKKNKNDSLKVAQAYRKIFASEEGKLVLGDLANFCGQFRTSFVSNDPHSTAFNEGQRRVFLRVNSFINKDERELMDVIQKLHSSVDVQSMTTSEMSKFINES